MEAELIELIKDYGLICDKIRLVSFQSHKFADAKINVQFSYIAALLEKKLNEAETILRIE